MKVIHFVFVFALFLLVFLLIAVPSFSPIVSADLSPEQQKIADLIFGANHTVRVMYMGNSRVARPTGFAFDGIEEIAYDAGRLAGNGFVIPVTNTGGGSNADNRFLYNNGFGMTLSTSWKALDSISQQHDHANFQGLALVPGRLVRMSYLNPNIPLLPKTVPLTLTVDYLAGPTMGVFNVTPVEVRGTSTVYSFPSTVIDSHDSSYHVAHMDIVLPALVHTINNRSFTLSGVVGNSTVYRTDVGRDVMNGIYVTEMAWDAHGYDLQANPTNIPAVSWTSYAEGERPDIVLWEYANNGGGNITAATKTLMDRINSVDPNALNVLLIDTPAPRKDVDKIISDSKAWAATLNGYDGAIVIDPNPYLPQDFVALGGSCKTVCDYGIYFLNDVHENRYGARIVSNAVWAALENYTK